MGYKALGFIIWNGVKLFLRWRFPGAPRKLALVGVGGTLVAAGVTGAVVAAARHRASS